MPITCLQRIFVEIPTLLCSELFKFTITFGGVSSVALLIARPSISFLLMLSLFSLQEGVVVPVAPCYPRRQPLFLFHPPPVVFLGSLLILLTFSMHYLCRFFCFFCFFKCELSENSDDEWAQARCAFEKAFALFLLFHKGNKCEISVK
jgi:hypothetical protein